MSGLDESLDHAAHALVAMYALCRGAGLTERERQTVRDDAPAFGSDGWSSMRTAPQWPDRSAKAVKDWIAGSELDPAYAQAAHEAWTMVDDEQLRAIAAAIEDGPADDSMRRRLARIWYRRAWTLRVGAKGDLRTDAHARMNALRRTLELDPGTNEHERELLTEIIEISETIDSRHRVKRYRKRLGEIGGACAWRGKGTNLEPGVGAVVLGIRDEAGHAEAWRTVRAKLRDGAVDEVEASETIRTGWMMPGDDRLPVDLLVASRQGMNELIDAIEELDARREGARKLIDVRVMETIAQGWKIRFQALRGQYEDWRRRAGEGEANPWQRNRHGRPDPELKRIVGQLEAGVASVGRAARKDRSGVARDPQLGAEITQVEAEQAKARGRYDIAWTMYTKLERIVDRLEAGLVREDRSEVAGDPRVEAEQVEELRDIAQLALATLAVRNGDAKRGRQYLRALEERHGTNARTGDLRMAVDRVEELDRRGTARAAGQTDSAEHACQAAEAWLKAGAQGIAERMASQILKTHPGERQALELKARCAARDARHADTMTAARQAIDAGAHGWHMHSLLALACDRQGLKEPASQAAKLALKAADNNQVASHRETEELLEIGAPGPDPEGIVTSTEERVWKVHGEELGGGWIGRALARAIDRTDLEAVRRWSERIAQLDPERLKTAMATYGVWRLDLVRERMTQALHRREVLQLEPATTPDAGPATEREMAWIEALEALEGIWSLDMIRTMARSECIAREGADIERRLRSRNEMSAVLRSSLDMANTMTAWKAAHHQEMVEILEGAPGLAPEEIRTLGSEEGVYLAEVQARHAHERQIIAEHRQ